MRPHTVETSRNVLKRYTPTANTASLLATLPFDMAREFYAKSVRLGLQESSLLASARFGRDLHQMEKLTLGPWARQG